MVTRIRASQRPLTQTVATNIGMALVNAAPGIIAARILGPQGRGALAAIQTWPSFLGSLAMLGMPEALVYFTAKDDKRGGRHLGSAMALALTALVVMMAIGWVAMPLLLSAQSARRF